MLPGWQPMRVGGHLALANAHLQMLPIDGGDPADVRLLPSESHYLAAVLDSQATVTPTTQPEAAGTPTPRIGDERIEASVSPWFPVAAIAAIVVGLAIFAVWRRRSQPHG